MIKCQAWRGSDPESLYVPVVSCRAPFFYDVYFIVFQKRTRFPIGWYLGGRKGQKAGACVI